MVIKTESFAAGSALHRSGELLLDVAVLAGAVGLLTWTWRHAALCTGLFAALVGVRFALSRERRDVVLFACGFVGASLAEVVQVAAGLYTYAQPGPLIIPWFNFFMWGVIFLTAAQLLGALEHWIGESHAQTSRRVVVAELSGYIVITAVLCALPTRSHFLAGLFLVALLMRLALVRRRNDVWFAAVGMLLGPSVEAWLVACGIYTFADPAIAGLLPLWHPIYWGLITLFLRRLFLARDLSALVKTR